MATQYSADVLVTYTNYYVLYYSTVNSGPSRFSRVWTFLPYKHSFTQDFISNHETNHLYEFEWHVKMLKSSARELEELNKASRSNRKARLLHSRYITIIYFIWSWSFEFNGRFMELLSFMIRSGRGKELDRRKKEIIIIMKFSSSAISSNETIRWCPNTFQDMRHSARYGFHLFRWSSP
jgi:hypothetical protein